MPTDKTQIVQLMLPWFDPAGELFYSAMSLSAPVKVDRRKAFKIMRKWYKSQIGVKVDKQTLERIWKRRHTTWAIEQHTVEEYIHQLARETYEETIQESNTDSQKETC